MRALARRGALAACLLVAGRAFGSNAPDWVTRAGATQLGPELLATRPAPDAAILWKQQIVTAGAITGSTRLYDREAIKILTPQGISAGTFFSTYDDDSKIEVEGAWTEHGDGSAEAMRLKDVVSVQLANAAFFTDQYIIAFRPPRLIPGDVAAYALWRKSRRDLYQWALSLQSEYPIAAQEVVIDLPEGWTHTWRLTSLPDGHTGPTSGSGGNKASYPFGPQRALPDEELAPPLADRAARFEVAANPPAGKFGDFVFRNWNEVGAWFERKSLAAREPVAADLTDVTASATDPQKAARWVQSKIRYVAVEAGEGGYVPRAPSVVARRLWGDCKDKSFLLIALLARLHVAALPVLTRPLNLGAIDPDFPSPILFDHVIVAIPAGAPTGLPAEATIGGKPYVLFDPTDAWTPYGELPGALQNARGLVVEADRADLIILPAAPAARNRLSRSIRGSIAPDGALHAAVSETTSGARCERGLYQTWSLTERQEGTARWVDRSLPGARFSDLTFKGLDAVSQPLQTRFRVDAEGFLQRTGPLRLVPLTPFSPAPDRVPIGHQRRSGIDLRFPQQRELDLELKLPPGWKVDGLPDPIDVDNVYARYHFSSSASGGTVRASEVFEIKKARVPLADLAAWETIARAIAEGSTARAVLVPGAP
jgi:Domain of Unknown Function with PDB structure (DUF3857)